MFNDATTGLFNKIQICSTSNQNNILKLFDISVALVTMDTMLPVVMEITFVQT